MGANTSVNYSTQVQTTMNDTVQNIQNRCAYTCGNKSENNTVVVENSSNVTFDMNQTCSVVGTSCVARTYLETDIQNVLNAVNNNSVVNDASYGLINADYNYSYISQYIRNNVTQQVDNFCQNNSTNNRNNLFVYVKNVNNGVFNLTQTGTVSNTQCSFDTTAKMSIINQETAKNENSVKNYGLFHDLAGMIGLIIIAVIIVATISGTKGKKKDDGEDQKETAKELEKATANISV